MHFMYFRVLLFPLYFTHTFAPHILRSNRFLNLVDKLLNWSLNWATLYLYPYIYILLWLSLTEYLQLVQQFGSEFSKFQILSVTVLSLRNSFADSLQLLDLSIVFVNVRDLTANVFNLFGVASRICRDHVELNLENPISYFSP